MTVDALRPGSALPLSAGAVVQPAYLQPLLRYHGLGRWKELPDIRATHLEDIVSVSSNCNNRVFSIEYEEERPELPSSMFLKMPVRSIATRAFMNTIMSWQLESAFYREVAPRLPVRTPEVYLALNRGSRFLMLMENLYDDPSVVLYINRDMIEGPELSVVRRCLETLAAIHASHHGISAAERERLLPAHLQPYTSPVMRSISPLMGRVALSQCLKRDDLQLSEEHVGWYRRAIDHCDELVDHWTREPLTLVHGDSHLGNHFLYGEQAGMLDWQAAQWGRGIRDVQYFLTDSLPAEVLAAKESELVRYYLDALARHGVELKFEEAWRDYRGYSFQTWMTIVVSMGFGAMTEDMNEVMPEIHRRCVASIERLALGDWLDETLG